MKNPDDALVKDIVDRLANMEDEQLKSFVVSHLNNIHSSQDPQISR